VWCCNAIPLKVWCRRELFLLYILGVVLCSTQPMRAGDSRARAANAHAMFFDVSMRGAAQRPPLHCCGMRRKAPRVMQSAVV
jgi:hypothetical protein